MKRLMTCVAASLVLLGAIPAGASPGAVRAVAIIAPTDRHTDFDEDGDVVISLAPSQPLAEGEFMVVRVDEQIVVVPPGLTKFAVTGISPGAHVVAAVIVDAEAKPVSRTEAITFLVGAGSRT